MHTSTDFELIQEWMIPWRSAHQCHFPAAKGSGWSAEEFGQVLSFHATSCAIVLNWFGSPQVLTLIGPFWSGLERVWSSECNSLSTMLLILSSYSLDYHLRIVLWTEAKHYLSTYAAQRWLDVFDVTAQNGPCPKVLNCDDLFECTKFLFCVLVICFLVCHWGLLLFFTLELQFLFLFGKHCHLFVCCVHVQ